MISLATLTLIGGVIEALMSAAVALPSVISAGKTAIALLQSNRDPTEAEAAAIRAALDEAHRALQAS